ncbi:HNH endonuclease [Moritella sp. F3]|uniref:HNH endonuclease n=1 Tax=Moritella sp. F3 TaxID=2718882 RepID=UPI0018E0FD9F|nr:HNH endonuclease [Moritella sp. F3]GIC76001.1 hypothetical protein FMO001_07280 [Moritella sp. F1]GIC81540.1 hypothetical protein FMO003_18210 [Moritella sp. F3]
MSISNELILSLLKGNPNKKYDRNSILNELILNYPEAYQQKKDSHNNPKRTVDEQIKNQAYRFVLENESEYKELTINRNCKPIQFHWDSENTSILTLQDMNNELVNLAALSLKGCDEKRRERLRKADKKPRKLTVTVTVYDRNPDVVAEVLLRAEGVCECCDSNAPFLRKSNKSHYLEVHHITPLSECGEDSVENSEALCPNCHREKHFG